MAAMLKPNGPSVTLSVLVSLAPPTRRQAFPQMGKQITKCSRKTTLFSSNVEHVYRPPGRHKQRSTTSNLLGRPLLGRQPVFSPSRQRTPQRWIRLQLSASSVVAGSSPPLLPLKAHVWSSKDPSIHRCPLIVSAPATQRSRQNACRRLLSIDQ